MWTSELPSILRYIIGDTECTPKYSDDKLSDIILIAAMQVNQELGLSYTTNINTLSIYPDPTLAASRNEDFIALLTLKAACILARSEMKLAGGNAFMFKQNTTTVDNRGTFDAQTKVSNSFCQDYKDAKWGYQVNGTAASGRGAAIMTPIKAAYGWYNNSHRSRLI